ncbi:MAG: hypothetical protein Q8P05_05795 [Candidatus Diapherotrites archaeon]|nr:hypothetical protein [Candidatus Diapherotrites archaeon]MDZ4256606.1 hypothetical protein [archaeon]
MNTRELTDLLISWITLSAAFALVFSNGGFGLTGFLPALAISSIAVGTGFLVHELSHKYVAIHFGAKAEFRAWNLGLAFALLVALLARFIFAAPGAVYIYGKNLTLKENGLISLAGPAANIVIGVIAIGIAVAYTGSQIGSVAGFVGTINFYLAMFNMLPIFILDGAKVFAWSKLVWAAVFIPLVIFLFF